MKKEDGFTAMMKQIEAMKYIIEYKIINGEYYCFGTVKGYDYSFKGATKESAVSDMERLLKNIGVPTNEVMWKLNAPVSISEPEFIDVPPVQYKKSRLDYL